MIVPVNKLMLALSRVVSLSSLSGLISEDPFPSCSLFVSPSMADQSGPGSDGRDGCLSGPHCLGFLLSTEDSVSSLSR